MERQRRQCHRYIRCCVIFWSFAGVLCLIIH